MKMDERVESSERERERERRKSLIFVFLYHRAHEGEKKKRFVS